MSTKDLWGELPDADDSAAPVQLLREQADRLEQRTDGELLGEVEQLPNRLHYVRFDLNIVVPSLRNYKYTVASIEYHPGLLYPVEIIDCVRGDLSGVKASDETEYREKLAAILTSSDTRRVIAALRRQARQQPA